MQPVVDAVMFIRFFIKHTIMPDTGPNEYAAISAGTSEKSSLRKDGINGTPKLTNMSAVESAAKIAVNAI